MEPVGFTKSMHEVLSCPSRYDHNMKHINRTEYIIQANKIIPVQNLLYTFFSISKTRLLCSIFCKLIALRNVRICLSSDANFQEVLSHNLKPHFKIQILPKRKDTFKIQMLVIQVGEKSSEDADILISGTEERLND